MNTPAVAVTITPATAGAPGGAVANHENEKEGSAAREKAGQRVFNKEGGCRRKIGENCVQQGEMVDRVEKKVASHSVSD